MLFSTTVEREDEETGELVTDRAHQKLFQLKSPSSKSKIDWKYTQHNIEATEGTIFRNATIYFMVQRALVQLFYILPVEDYHLSSVVNGRTCLPKP